MLVLERVPAERERLVVDLDLVREDADLEREPVDFEREVVVFDLARPVADREWLPLLVLARPLVDRDRLEALRERLRVDVPRVLLCFVPLVVGIRSSLLMGD